MKAKYIMQQVTSWKLILEYISNFRSKGCFVNNFYPNESEMTEWIENARLFTVSEGDDAHYIVHKTEIADFIYFFVKDLTDLKTELPKLQDILQARVIAFDYISKSDEERNLIKEICSSCGYELHTSLKRMSVVLKDNSFEEEQEITFAINEDIDSLLKMFNSAFDPVSERIPTREQLKKYIGEKSVLVCKKQDKIAGFAVVEIQKKSMYLKHLLTNPSFRRQGVAEKLLNKAFFLSKECIRFMLWVIDSNTPAINLYKKFGYDFEALSNFTFVSKNNEYL